MLKFDKIFSSKMGKRVDIDFDEGSKTVNLYFFKRNEVKHKTTFSLSFPILFDIEAKNKIWSIEILGYPTEKIPFDVYEHIRSKEVKIGQFSVTELKEDQDENYEKLGDKEVFMVRFPKYETKTFYQTNKNVFFGFDKNGILSEIVYFGEGASKKYQEGRTKESGTK